MKALFILTLLAAAPPASGAAPAGDDGKGQGGITQAEAEAIAGAITAPAIHITRWSQALVPAKLKLVEQLRERFPLRRPPDRALIRACMRMTLRLNNTWLRGMTGTRAYPAARDFDSFAAAGEEAVKKYEDGLGKDHAWGPVDDRAAQDLLDRELRRGLNRLPLYKGSGMPPEPPPSKDEKEFLPK